MPDPKAVDQIINQLTSLEAQGQKVVPIQALTRALVGLKPEDAQSFEGRKLRLQADLEDFKVKAVAKVETFKSVIDTAKSALSTIILINGGATVALLALIGNLAKTTPGLSKTPDALIFSTGCFAFGVFFGALATGGMYFTQYLFNEGNEEGGYLFQKVTVGMAVIALMGFVLGVAAALNGFR